MRRASAVDTTLRLDRGPRSARWATAACLLALTNSVWAPQPCHAEAIPLTQEEFRQIGEQGFGDRGNSYVWSTAFFRGKLYVGSNRNFSCIVRTIRGGSSSGTSDEVPIECEAKLTDMDLRGRIYTYDPATNQVELVYVAPMVPTLSSDGSTVFVPRDLGYRSMIVFREADGTEALYTTTFTSSDSAGGPARILRSVDGQTFEALPGDAINNRRYRSFRSLTTFDDRMFVIALGSTEEDSVLLEASDPASGAFAVVSEPAFGDPVNVAAFELAVFRGYLYIGTATTSAGFQLLKTRATGPPPYKLEKVLVEGAYKGSKNQNVVSLMPFKDHLYVGSGLNLVALGFFTDVETAPAELLRVGADDHWEIVCGEARPTPDGFKEPISGRDAGCGNLWTGYIWRMIEHDGVLYMGTLDLSVMAQFRDDISMESLEEQIDAEAYPHLLPVLDAVGPEEILDVISAVEGGFDLWASTDGKTWEIVSRTGFGDSFSYGVRSFESTPHGLFVGTANPFFGFRLFLGQTKGTDTDGDSFADADDNCPLAWNLNQRDRDDDGVGDVCDADDDGDCIPDDVDPNPHTADLSGGDLDGDGLRNACDNDVDGDGVLNVQDNCPATANLDQADEDGDGVGDVCDPTGSSGDNGGTGTDVPNDDSPAQTIPTPCGALNWITFAVLTMGLAPMRSRFRGGRRLR